MGVYCNFLSVIFSFLVVVLAIYLMFLSSFLPRSDVCRALLPLRSPSWPVVLFLTCSP